MSVVILRGDAANLPMADESVDLICTSPPYWNQRAYTDNGEVYDGQIGNESTPGEYIDALLECTKEWVRVLKPSGSIWVVLGDKYSDRADGGPSSARSGREDRAEVLPPGRSSAAFAPRKSLLMLPERYRIACVDQLSLTARAKVVWHKPSPMPESVTDRVKVSHEDVVHLVKGERYFSALDEVRWPLASPGRKAGKTAFGARNASHLRAATGEYDGQNPLGAVPGSVWEIATVPLVIPPAVAHARCCGGLDPGCENGLAHYAAYPPALCRRIITGWSPSGICTACGEGRRPVSTGERVNTRPLIPLPAHLAAHGEDGRAFSRGITTRAITGYACACPQPDAPTRPAVVLDPFAGTGTTMLTASVLGRVGVGVDRSADYCRIAQWRTADPAERARALGVPKPPPVGTGQGSLFDGLEDGAAS